MFLRGRHIQEDPEIRTLYASRMPALSAIFSLNVKLPLIYKLKDGQITKNTKEIRTEQKN